jgi:hypothetical protein
MIEFKVIDKLLADMGKHLSEIAFPRWMVEIIMSEIRDEWFV